MNDSGPQKPSKLTIGSADVPTARYTVVAHYNPKDIDLAHQTSWSDEGAIKGMVANERDLYNDLQYTGAPARTMSLELFLDSYEPDPDKEPVEAIIRRLHELASPRDERSNDPQLLRPHICLVAWSHKQFPTFRCVIEALNVKYTMFSREGRPVRAVCNVKLKEARLSKELRGR